MFLSLATFGFFGHHLFGKRAAGSAYHLSHLLTDVTSYDDLFLWVECERSSESDCISS